MRILHWHVHAAWTTSLLRTGHTVLLPVVPDRGPDGRGRARTYPWPDIAVEVAPEDLREADVDVAVLQRPEEIELCERWTGRRPGRDLPAVFVEHNAPQGRIAEMRHPLADQDAIAVVHVTHFNALFWDCSSAPTHVIEHGIVDPGQRYTGELPRAAAAINEACRRGRVTGTDLLPRFADAVPLDLFGIGSALTPWGVADLPWTDLHAEMARRRAYLHPIRWTSLGLSLLEAMHLGMPVVALATTEVREAVPEEAGVVSNRLDVLCDALRDLVADPDQARERGRAARHAARARYGIERFVADWNALLARLAGSPPVTAASVDALPCGTAPDREHPNITFGHTVPDHMRPSAPRSTRPMAPEPAEPPRLPARRLRITVVRALPGLGDLLCAVPALRALAAHDVTYVGLESTRALVERFGAYVDRFVPFPGWPGLPETPVEPGRIAAFLVEARRQPVDLALQLHGSGTASAAFVQLLGARATAGYVPPGAPRPGAGWLEWVEDEPEARRPLRLLEHVGLPTAGEALELPVTAADEREAAALGLEGRYAIVHPGSSLPDRRWPAERFAAAADGLHARGLRPVLTGTVGEADVVAAVSAAMRAPHRTLAGRTSLGAFACAVRDAALVLCNDTGASHVAAAVGTPSVVVFRVTDPARWAPLDAARHRRARADASVGEVLAQADALLDTVAAP